MVFQLRGKTRKLYCSLVLGDDKTTVKVSDVSLTRPPVVSGRTAVAQRAILVGWQDKKTGRFHPARSLS
jgi:hypothetical protein